MACTSVTLNGIALDCGAGLGGLKTLYIVDVLDLSGTPTVSGSTITGITMQSGKKFQKFDFRKGNANFVSTGNTNDQNGTSFVSTVVTANFNKMEAAKRTEMQNIVKASTAVIAVDENGLNWFIGYNSYASGSVNANTGSAMGDANNYVLTLTALTAGLPYEVTAGALSAVI